MKPRFSVVTICFNDLAGLKRTYESVRSQTYYEEIEHIVVDGGSSDRTVEFLEQAAGENPMLRYVSEPDEGIADAMEKGARVASGVLVMHLNAGDALLGADVVQRVVDSWTEHHWQWGVGDLLYEGQDGLYRKRLLSFSPDELRRRCYLPQPATVFDAELIPKLTFDRRLRIAMDYDLFCRLAFVEGLRPFLLGFDVTRFDQSGVSSDFWRAYRENVRVRLRYPGVSSYLHEVRTFLVTLARRGARRVLLLALGPSAKRRVAPLASTDGWRLEFVGRDEP